MLVLVAKLLLVLLVLKGRSFVCLSFSTNSDNQSRTELLNPSTISSLPLAFGVEMEFQFPDSLSKLTLKKRYAAAAAEMNAALEEYESERAPVTVYAKYQEAHSKVVDEEHWKVEKDSSVWGPAAGFEVVSPLLSGPDTPDAMTELRAILQSLRSFGATLTERTGLHVHVDATGRTLEELRNVYKVFLRFERAMDTIQPYNRRGSNSYFCNSLREKTDSLVHSYELLDACDSTLCLMNVAQPIHDEEDTQHHYKLNLAVHARDNSTSFEFRGHYGTLDHRTVEVWIELVVRLVDGAFSGVGIENATRFDVKDRNLRDLLRTFVPGREEDFFSFYVNRMVSISEQSVDPDSIYVRQVSRVKPQSSDHGELRKSKAGSDDSEKSTPFSPTFHTGNETESRGEVAITALPLSFGVEMEFQFPDSLSNKTLKDRYVAAAAAMNAALEEYEGSTRVPVRVYAHYREAHSKAVDEEHWKVEKDSSVWGPARGFEVVSPILSGHSAADAMSELAAILRSLRAFGATLSERTGMHVHVDATGRSITELRNLYRNFLRFERAMDTIQPYNRRDSNNYYANSLRDKTDSLAHVYKALDACDTVPCLMNVAQPVHDQESKQHYYKLNLATHARDKSITFEFRGHHGTLDYRTVEVWVELVVRFVHGSFSGIGVGNPPNFAAKDGTLRDLLHSFVTRREEDFFSFYVGRMVMLAEESVDPDSIYMLQVARAKALSSSPRMLGNPEKSKDDSKETEEDPEETNEETESGEGKSSKGKKSSKKSGRGSSWSGNAESGKGKKSSKKSGKASSGSSGSSTGKSSKGKGNVRVRSRRHKGFIEVDEEWNSNNVLQPRVRFRRHLPPPTVGGMMQG